MYETRLKQIEQMVTDNSDVIIAQENTSIHSCALLVSIEFIRHLINFAMDFA